MDDETRVYRRYLPHWRETAAIYFVTWGSRPGQEALTIIERDHVAASLQHFNHTRYELFAYVVMNDHVHVVVQPLGDFTLERIVHDWKSFSTVCMQRGHRRGRIWQREYYDRIIRDDTEFAAKIEYILSNPTERWPGIERYPWTWCRRDCLE